MCSGRKKILVGFTWATLHFLSPRYIILSVFPTFLRPMISVVSAIPETKEAHVFRVAWLQL